MSTNRNTPYQPLSVQPVNFSLFAATGTPAPPASPPHSTHSSIARPPTPGRGPLTSHPTTPVDVAALPPTPEPEHANLPMSKPKPQGPDGVFRVPASPASAADSASQHIHSPEPQRKPTGVRKLFSMSSLRSSFTSSRTSLSLSTHTSERQMHPMTGTKRPSSPSMASTTASSFGGVALPRPELRKKKSASWFRRKSSMFVLNEDAGFGLDSVDENQRPDTRDSKRVKETPAPYLPQIGALSGGHLDGGNIGWDEGMFKR
ncbi:hypothetical protein Tdes44962_MAKER03455 [Teratosphaeria destructans]|uniref:Uncharacterized protein n=1 Tax=Teratosphaeria destructans TaxID=418781 RepID=A0A9W7W141_9PEZI|nr:hypothetical protein Tdes44962_MAKER03455 [Teratosphaeria destructans]